MRVSVLPENLICSASFGGPQELHHMWNMGGRIFELSPIHLDKLAALLRGMPELPAAIAAAQHQVQRSARAAALAAQLGCPRYMASHGIQALGTWIINAVWQPGDVDLPFDEQLDRALGYAQEVIAGERGTR
jgi:hypothetical protein